MGDLYTAIFSMLDREIAGVINRERAWRMEEPCRTQAAHLASSLAQAFEGDDSIDVAERAGAAARTLVFALLQIPRSCGKRVR